MFEPLNVLIVDDSLLAEHALKSYFVKLGHNVVALAKNGEVGKELFNQHQPDLVTVDAVMPGISGQDFIKYLNAEDEANGTVTKILMISSDIIEPIERGEMRVDGYIVKPITMAKLKEVLDSL